MEKEKIDLSIITLSYNSKIDLARLLPSIFGSESIDFSSPLPSPPRPGDGIRGEVIIVDNGSTDGVLDWLPTTHYPLKTIINKNNGFSHGNNLGIKKAQGKYILILNPDTELKPDTLQNMLEFMDTHQDVGISTCKVLLPDGKLDLACRRRFPNPWNGFKRLFLLSNSDYNFTDADENQSMEIDSCMGAFMMIRRDILQKIKNLLPEPVEGANSSSERSRAINPSTSLRDQNFAFFDESFFMYGEDLDLCWRVKESGKKVWYYPATSITHYKGSSSRKVSYKALKWFHDAMWIFYRKHYKQSYPFFLNWLVWLGIKIRYCFLTGYNFFRREKFVSSR